VAPAGDQEVVVAVQAQLDRALQRAAASAATQANSADCDSLPPKPPPMRRHSTCTGAPAAQRVRHQVLHLAGVLGGAVHQQAAVFLRHGVGDLAFQVELLLAAERKLPCSGAARRRQRGAASPRARCIGGTTYCCAAWASRGVSTGGQRLGLVHLLGRAAARRASSRVVATTANTGWPR
jgi:hypothetical protein